MLAEASNRRPNGLYKMEKGTDGLIKHDTSLQNPNDYHCITTTHPLLIRLLDLVSYHTIIFIAA